MSDEEKKAINSIKRKFECEQTRDNYKILIGLYKNVEIEILVNLVEKQSKEIEELKDNNELLQKNYSSAYEDINWFCEKYISKKESEQKERKAYIKGTNDADKLCNKKWKEKIKSKIEEYDDKGMTINLANRRAGKTFQQAVHYEVKKVLQSLLEKE